MYNENVLEINNIFGFLKILIITVNRPFFYTFFFLAQLFLFSKKSYPQWMFFPTIKHLFFK
ncbi:hypothetical protein DRF58_17905 [Epilithonimonas hispanica]|uniref:Uncharacterized protein n=1 Tax=Epilithonimonas hispanica TaxID=358687 RepID=A0A3D9CIC5_9FLAO|nr:hypothetical protein DRF58_17905 [Epilithonimonas hispanica]